MKRVYTLRHRHCVSQLSKEILMDLSVIKDQLGNFATFVKGFGDIVDNLPMAVKALGVAVNTFSSK